ncbi:MAG: pectate lyase [Treponema sp.]|nr:pectate lyase [Treponema sp.]
MKRIVFLLVTSVLVFSCASNADRSKETEAEWTAKNERAYEPVDVSAFDDSISHARKSFKNHIPTYKVYNPSQIVGIAENMLYLQNPDGGWKKNYDWLRKYYRNELEGQQNSLKKVPPLDYHIKTNGQQSTLDNRNIYSQIEYLALVYQQVPDPRYKESALRAFNWILNAQHPLSGGWTGSDVYGITYNDDIMSGTMTLLRDIASGLPQYAFLGKKAQAQAKAAYDKAIQCVIRTQIKIPQSDGSELLTAWCQQHDHETLQPIWARAFEPPSITIGESVELVLMLMKDPNPSDELKKCISAACEFLLRDDLVLKGKKIVRKSAKGELSDLGQYTDFETFMEDDPNAPALWARMYDIQTLKPIWCDRNRKICDSFNDMSKERRNGYSYTGKWVEKLRSPYAAWKEKYLK